MVRTYSTADFRCLSMMSVGPSPSIPRSSTRRWKPRDVLRSLVRAASVPRTQADSLHSEDGDVVVVQVDFDRSQRASRSLVSHCVHIP